MPAIERSRSRARMPWRQASCPRCTGTRSIGCCSPRPRPKALRSWPWTRSSCSTPARSSWSR